MWHRTNIKNGVLLLLCALNVIGPIQGGIIVRIIYKSLQSPPSRTMDCWNGNYAAFHPTQRSLSSIQHIISNNQ